MELSACTDILKNNGSGCSDKHDGHIKNVRSFEGRRGYSCGYCNEKCFYSAIEIGFIIGVLANLVVITRVIRDRKLRDPTFIGIAALAVADLLFLTLNLTVSFETVIITYTCAAPRIISRPFYIMNSMTWFAANSHVALLAVIRYLSLAHPFRATVFLRPVRVILLSVGVWVLGIILLGSLAVLITLGIIIPGTSGEFVVIWWITVYLMPLIVTVVLHVLKICLVKQSVRISSSKSANRKLVQRMSTVVIMVIVMAAVLPLPRLVYNCLRVVGNSAFPSKQFKLHLRGISHMVYLINHFVNPFMYAFLSKKFRNSLKEAYCCDIINKVESCETTESQMSSTRRQTSLDNVTPTTSTIAACENDVIHGNMGSIIGYDIIETPT